MPAVVIRRGDADAGQVMIVRNLLDGTFEVFARTFTLDGDPAWRAASGEDPVDGEAVRSLIDREARFDPDLWVIEIEDRDRKYELDGPLVEGRSR